MHLKGTINLCVCVCVCVCAYVRVCARAHTLLPYWEFPLPDIQTPTDLTTS